VDTPTNVTDLDIVGESDRTGVKALDLVDIFNILCLPKPATTDYTPDMLGTIAEYCAGKRAILLVDSPSAWADNAFLDFRTVASGYPITGNFTANAAFYFPNIKTTNAITGVPDERGPCGAVAGVWAATDAARGVWKAPAGTNAGVTGIADLSATINDEESGVLNPLAVNCLRTVPLVGPVIWGARTCRGADALADQWKYIPVRRTALFIEESLRRGTQWIVFEPNDEPLWAAIRLNVGAFMNSLFRQGAFQGSTPQEAYLVKCDKENNPQNDIDRGIVNILVGFAPLKPAEFVIIHIQQLAGQLQT
jgi:phage tail sheath protein FI